MAKKERGESAILKIVLIILSIIAVVLVAVIIIINVIPSGDVADGKTSQEIMDEGFTILGDEGLEASQKYFDEYIEKAKNNKEKIEYLKLRIKAYSAECDFGCRDQIIADIHKIAELANGDTSLTEDLCDYQRSFLDDDPIEGCDYNSRGGYNGE